MVPRLHTEQQLVEEGEDGGQDDGSDNQNSSLDEISPCKMDGGMEVVNYEAHSPDVIPAHLREDAFKYNVSPLLAEV